MTDILYNFVLPVINHSVDNIPKNYFLLWLDQFCTKAGGHMTSAWKHCTVKLSPGQVKPTQIMEQLLDFAFRDIFISPVKFGYCPQSDTRAGLDDLYDHRNIFSHSDPLGWLTQNHISSFPPTHQHVRSHCQFCHNFHGLKNTGQIMFHYFIIFLDYVILEI